MANCSHCEIVLCLSVHCSYFFTLLILSFFVGFIFTSKRKSGKKAPFHFSIIGFNIYAEMMLISLMDIEYTIVGLRASISLCINRHKKCFPVVFSMCVCVYAFVDPINFWNWNFEIPSSLPCTHTPLSFGPRRRRRRGQQQHNNKHEDHEDEFKLNNKKIEKSKTFNFLRFW